MFRFALFCVALFFTAEALARELNILFLGDRGHHRPAERFAQLQPVLAARGVKLTYTENVGDLNKDTLAKYDGLVVYANIDEIRPEQEAALLEYVAAGHGFIPLHCASYCFRNSPKYVELVGAQFQRHGKEVMRTTIALPDHEIMRGFAGFESFDETYHHTKHNEANRVVLETHAEKDKDGKELAEPWTWTRTHAKGRVFYTAWGHDDKTWAHAGFHNLVERGIRWACHDDPQLAGPYSDLASYQPKMTARRTDVKPFEYVEAKVPFYPAGGPRKGDGAWNKMQLPLSPEESLKHYVHPDDFELRLFAAEPDIGKSLAMTWDARGRLWLCETVDYPNDLAPEGKGRDRIRICEDTDGDGRADKFTVFAEQLSIPTTLAFHRGGVIVQNATETLYLRDTDGDDKADTRKVLLTGWAAGDTHGGVSNFRYGLDNWYWAMQGYNNSTPTRPAYEEKVVVSNDEKKDARVAGAGAEGEAPGSNGSPTGASLRSAPATQSKHVPAKVFGTFRMGFFRFRLSNDDDPIVTDLEFIRSTNNNTWGLGISEEGLIFGSTANGNPSEFMPIPNRYYEAVRGWSAPTLGGIAADNHFDAVTENVRQVDHHGGFTAACGHALYTARNYPQAYWNRTAFVCEPTGHLVATFVLEPSGAGFRSRNGWNLVASDDEWAAPVMAEVGPDGNVWVLDWYNYIVQHNPTPVGFQTGKGNAYETELRDKRHGRVFRVVPKGWNELTDRFYPDLTMSLERLGPVDLIPGLSNPIQLWRSHAQRILVEHGPNKDVDARLREASMPTKFPDGPVRVGSVHAIRTNAEFLGPNNRTSDKPPLSAEELDVRQDDFRKYVKDIPTEVLQSMIEVMPRRLDILKWWGTDGILVHHPNAQVRLAWLLAISEMPASAEGAHDALAALTDPRTAGDRILLDAAICAAARHDVYFLNLLAKGNGSGKTPLPPGEDARRAGEGDAAPVARADDRANDPLIRPSATFSREGEKAVSAAALEVATRVAEHFARGFAKGDGPLIRPSGTFSREGEKEVNTASREGEKAVSEVRPLLIALSTSNSPYVPAIVEGLARGWPKDGAVALDNKTEEAIVALLKNLPRGSQGRLVSLAERLGSKRMVEYGAEITAALLAEASDAKLDGEKRLAAARQAVEFRKTDEAVAAALLKLLTPRTSPELAGGLLQALAGGEVDTLGRLVVEKLPVVTPAARKEAVRLLLAREAWTPALLGALEKGTLGVGELALDQKQALATHPNKQLQSRAKKLLASSGGLPNPDRQRVLDELQSLTEQKADAAAGKLVFVKQCAKCHMHSGEGQKIGPDLTGMAVHPKRELLVHLIDPNRSVEGNFRVYTVVTDDGRVLTGLLAAESKTAIEVVDAEAKRHVLQRDAIEELTASMKSLMPEGFEKQVSKDDLANLLEFLTARGKFFPLDLRKAATAVSVRGMFYSEESTVERLVFPDWSPKTFAGVPFTLVDPQGGRTPNVILLNSTNGKLPPTMPSAVRLACNSPMKALHLLSGVSGWGYNGKGGSESTSMIVRLHYADGKTEDHPLVNGKHFADYIRRVDVPDSQFAFDLGGRQVRYLAVRPNRAEAVVSEVEFVKGPDRSAPIVVAATVESP